MTDAARVVLFWDIDGTLLTTGRAGIAAWETAVEVCTGVRPDLTAYATAGVTDHAIASQLVTEFGGTTPPAIADLVAHYEAHLPAALPRREGRVLPGARELLEATAGRSDVGTLLLTGNTQRGARAKLAHYGLSEYFRRGGAFSDDAPDRPGIARAALARARDALGWPTFDAVVIGDTPHDVACGRAIAARVLAVGTGAYAPDALAAAGAWWAVPSLPDPTVVLRRLGLGA